MGWDQNSNAANYSTSNNTTDTPQDEQQQQSRAVFGFRGTTNDPNNTSKKSHERWDPVMTSLLKASSASSHISHSQSLPTAFLTGGGPPNIDLSQPLHVHESLTTAPMDNSSNVNSPLILQGQNHLNAPSSVGAASTKVNKKRSRASRRPPTTILEADSSNFRSMVQHLTGIPAPPPMPLGSRFDQFLSSGLVRPQATRAFSSLSFSPGSVSMMEHPLHAPSGFYQYQPPYSLRRLENQQQLIAQQQQQQQQQQQYRETSSFSLDPSKLMVPVSSIASATSAAAAQAQQPGVYLPGQGGNSNAWECEGENLNAGVKREDGRPLASWSTSL